MRQSKLQQGIVTLESAAMFLVLIPVLVGLCAIVDYATQSSELSALVDREVFDTGVNPLTLEFSGSYGTVVNHNDLEIFVENVANRIETNIGRVSSNLGNADYLIEVGYSELSIDESSGASGGFRSFPFTFSETRGALSPSSEIRERIKVDAELQSIEQLSLGSGAHVYAVPTVHFSDQTSPIRFVDSIVIVAARVAITLEDSFVGDNLDFLGVEPYLYSRKVVLLRGDINS